MAPQDVAFGQVLRWILGLLRRTPRLRPVIFILLIAVGLFAVLTSKEKSTHRQNYSRLHRNDELLIPAKFRQAAAVSQHFSLESAQLATKYILNAHSLPNEVIPAGFRPLPQDAPPKKASVRNRTEEIDEVSEYEQYSKWRSKRILRTKSSAGNARTPDTGVADLDQESKHIPNDLFVLLQALLKRDFESPNTSNHVSTVGMDKDGRCLREYFRIKGMQRCHEWLRCDEIKRLQRGEVYGSGVGKRIFSAHWQSHKVAVVVLRKDRVMYKKFVARVQSGVENALLTQPSPYTTQVLGYCTEANSTTLVMEACKERDLRWFMAGPLYRKLSVLDKLKLAIQIVAGFDYLHNGLKLPRIHCDLHSVAQAFGQYLVSDDLRIFLNDLDELPEVDRAQNKFAYCESEPMGLMGQPRFLAPEIRYGVSEYEKGTHLKPVDEKSDVWKIPDLAANILAIDQGRRDPTPLDPTYFKYYFERELRPIHERCKRMKHTERPSSREVLIEYLKVYQKYLDSNEP